MRKFVLFYLISSLGSRIRSTSRKMQEGLCSLALLSARVTRLQKEVFVLLSSGASADAPSAATNPRSASVRFGGC